MRIGLLYSVMEKNLTGINRLTKGTLEEILRLDKENRYYSLDDDYLKLGLESTQPYLLSLNGGGRILSNTQLNLAMSRLMDMKIYMNDIDLLHSYYRPVDTVESACKKVITIYDITPSVHPEWAAGKEYYDTSIKRSAEIADKVIAISEYTKADLVNYYNISPEKISVIYPGLEKALKFDYADKEKLPDSVVAEEYILSVCSLAPHKNLKGLIKSFIRFKQENKGNPLKLVLVGRPIQGHDLMKYIAEFEDIKDDIIFTGFIDDMILTSLYRYAIGVMYISFYEGFGLPILEAMAAGKAVVSSNTTSMPEVGGDAVLYCNPYDDESIYNAMCLLVTDGKLREQLKEKAIKQTKKFSYRRAAEETLKLYKEV